MADPETPKRGPGDVVFECRACHHRFLVPLAALREPEQGDLRGSIVDLALTGWIASSTKDEAAQAALLTGYDVRAAAARAEEAANRRHAEDTRLRYTQCPRCRSGSAVRYFTPEELEQIREARRREEERRRRAEEQRKRAIEESARRRRLRRQQRAAFFAERGRTLAHAYRSKSAWLPHGLSALGLVLIVAGACLPWRSIIYLHPPPYLVIGAPAFWGPERLGVVSIAVLSVVLAIRRARGDKGVQGSMRTPLILANIAGALALASVLGRDFGSSSYMSEVAAQINRELAQADLSKTWGLIGGQDLRAAFPGQLVTMLATGITALASAMKGRVPRTYRAPKRSSRSTLGAPLRPATFGRIFGLGLAAMALGTFAFALGRSVPEFGLYRGEFFALGGLMACLFALERGLEPPPPN